jgi:hypothetical protein
MGIERTTDQRSPEYRLVRLSPRRARAWLAEGGKAAWSGAADERLPVGQQNWHRRIRAVYAMPPGSRLPTRGRWGRDGRWRSTLEEQVAAVERMGVAWEP